MGAPTSKDIAAATLVLLPFNLITLALRFWIRVKWSAWGGDDWAMVVTLPVWVVSQVGLLGMAWSGIGQRDSTLSEQQIADSLFWFYVFQEFWCFTLVTLKWSIGFTLLRIDGGNRWVRIVIYSCLAFVTICTGGTGMYLFFQCYPVEKNWHSSLPGECKPRQIQTALSFLVAAVSITTDWAFALLPFALLYRLQIARRTKVALIGLLSLGFFASIAPIVRLKYLLLMNDSTRLLEALGIILAWAQAEVGIGMLVANLPACKPLLERIFSLLTLSRNGAGRTGNGVTGYNSASGADGHDNYLELDGPDDSTSDKAKHCRGLRSPYGVMDDTNVVYQRDMANASSDSLVDDRSQNQIIPSRGSPARNSSDRQHGGF
ncbi:uncharacterized protein B0I36DRAFT_400083 [Microdochium trichocladiopsis]|uniref:Rhodopsin domain-containing protein n=1 Tax=Microdochium trichocladiopsis TaxID=1682393 RepID=A0A9P8XTM9_9PEZI|nr:uncharacterized protein B0I36DRAFT_400083 [Microdochium trichocladiopsis]KAH7012119.1 hypothetical protein B0I36DRAFT_400083 [Microdochium trichocladiopsis]